MRIVYPTDPCYDEDRQISNARFNLSPAAIAYATRPEEVVEAIEFARGKKWPVRIRSGGHQHEGMCSGDGVLMIDVTGMHDITFDPSDPSLVWIGAGARLKDIYATLWQKSYMFSGGGCKDVHVGGLAQGGGWGPVSRQYGLTCDTLVAADIVTAESKNAIPLTLNGSGHERQLLWGLRGGGGGNFGVVTRYGFRVSNQHKSYTDIELKWRDLDFKHQPAKPLDRFILHWIDNFPKDTDRRLTTFLRLSAVKDEAGDRVIIGGRYLGVEAEARAAMARLLDGQALPYAANYSPSMDPLSIAAVSKETHPAEWDHIGRALGSLPGYQPGPELTAGSASESTAVAAAPAAYGALPPPDVTDTCAGVPLRHKISSGFATSDFGLESVRLAIHMINEATYNPEARQYVSFHCLGGAVSDQPVGGNSFAFRDRRFLLQYQAWWMPKRTDLDPTMIAWIQRFRNAMADFGHTRGAFINFVDRDIPVANYYADSFDTLRDVKAYWDTHNFFKFDLSIPPAGVDA